MSDASQTAPALAVTMGDPRGIGPEVIVKALARADLPDLPLRVIGSLTVLEEAARAVRIPLAVGGSARQVVDLDNFPAERLEPRRPDALSGRASLDYVERAVRMALEGRAGGVVTAPISKEAIQAAGSPFPGHTEMLAALGGAGRPVMLLVGPRLRVAFVTTHLALRDVPDAVTTEGIVETAQVLDRDLRRFFGLEAARIAVCGLNPHCGDGGRFGDEEARIIEPAVARAREAAVDLRGPRPADTVFHQAVRGDYDAVLALYHDQGMGVVKLDGLKGVVNVTLGLPFVRTSVGHGTAYDIAGTGRADEGSLVAAIRLAARMLRAGVD